MSNLIDANELYIRIREQVKSPAIVGCLGGIIAEVPTFGLDDLRPKGRWVKDHGRCWCSECRQGIKGNAGDFDLWLDLSTLPFCPSCGADMRKEGAFCDTGRN